MLHSHRHHALQDNTRKGCACNLFVPTLQPCLHALYLQSVKIFCFTPNTTRNTTHMLLLSAPCPEAQMACTQDLTDLLPTRTRQAFCAAAVAIAHSYLSRQIPDQEPKDCRLSFFQKDIQTKTTVFLTPINGQV